MPHSESTITRYNTHALKMDAPVLTTRKEFKSFEQDVRIYSKYMDFESVLTTDPPMDVGAPGNDRSAMMRRGISGKEYDKQLRAWVFFSNAFRCK